MMLMNIKKYKNIIILGTIIFIIVIFAGIYLVHASSISDRDVIESSNLELEQEKNSLSTIQEENYVLIDIKGAVNNPGVYQLKEGCSVIDAINMAGGLAEGANTNVINLSKKLVDEMVIIIYTNEQIEAYNKEDIITEFIYVEVPCTCPDEMNDACISDQKSDENSQNKISINIATKEELMTLPGVGESKAELIIEYRKNNGFFNDITEIKNVSGIGEAAFEKIKDSITI